MTASILKRVRQRFTFVSASSASSSQHRRRQSTVETSNDNTSIQTILHSKKARKIPRRRKGVGHLRSKYNKFNNPRDGTNNASIILNISKTMSCSSSSSSSSSRSLNDDNDEDDDDLLFQMEQNCCHPASVNNSRTNQILLMSSASILPSSSSSTSNIGIHYNTTNNNTHGVDIDANDDENGPLVVIDTTAATSGDNTRGIASSSNTFHTNGSLTRRSAIATVSKNTATKTMKKIPNVSPLVSFNILPIVSCDTNDNANRAQYQQQQRMNDNRQDCATKSKNHDVTPTESTSKTKTTEDPLLLSSLSYNNNDDNNDTDEMKRNSILRKKIQDEAIRIIKNTNVIDRIIVQQQQQQQQQGSSSSVVASMLRYPKPTTTATTAVAATARRGKKKNNNSNNENYTYTEVSAKKQNNSKNINTDNKTLRVQYVLDPNGTKKHRKEYDICCDTTCRNSSNTVIQTIDRTNSIVSSTTPILLRNTRRNNNRNRIRKHNIVSTSLLDDDDDDDENDKACIVTDNAADVPIPSSMILPTPASSSSSVSALSFRNPLPPTLSVSPLSLSSTSNTSTTGRTLPESSAARIKTVTYDWKSSSSPLAILSSHKGNEAVQASSYYHFTQGCIPHHRNQRNTTRRRRRRQVRIIEGRHRNHIGTVYGMKTSRVYLVQIQRQQHRHPKTNTFSSSSSSSLASTSPKHNHQNTNIILETTSDAVYDIVEVPFTKLEFLDDDDAIHHQERYTEIHRQDLSRSISEIEMTSF